MRRLAIAPFVVGALVAALVGTLVMPGPGSEAFWSASTSGGSSQAQATTVQRVGTPSATVATQNDVTVSWPSATLGDGTAVDGYVVARTNVDTGSMQAATGACARTVAATSCVETDVPDGRWTYSIMARFGSWAGPASASSAVIIADTVAPTNALTIDVTSGRAVLVGATVWFRGAGNGSLRIVNALRDDLSGPAQSVTGMLTGSTAGWSHTPGAIGSQTNGAYVSNPVSWAPGTSANPTLGISGIDVAGNTAATTLTFANDVTPPTGGSISYDTTTRRTSTAAGSVSISLGAASDAGSGMDGGSRILQQRWAPLTGDSCGSYSAYANVQGNPATSVTVSASVNTCVQYRYVVRDAVDNERITEGGVVKVKPPYASVVQGTDGLMRLYRFDGTGANVPNSMGANNGTAYGSPTTGQPGAISGDDSSSMFFDGSDDYVRTARGNIGNQAFSIEVWFNTTQRFGSGSQWYNGAGLVDAEVPMSVNDFGLSLVDGRVAAGVGNPDTTILSPARYSDGQWHHVVMTRDRSTGLVILYVDGVEVGRAAGGTQQLSTPSSIDFGRLQTGINYYRGYLDEIAIYNRVMSPEDVQAHYANGL